MNLMDDYSIEQQIIIKQWLLDNKSHPMYEAVIGIKKQYLEAMARQTPNAKRPSGMMRGLQVALNVVYDSILKMMGEDTKRSREDIISQIGRDICRDNAFCNSTCSSKNGHCILVRSIAYRLVKQGYVPPKFDDEKGVV